MAEWKLTSRQTIREYDVTGAADMRNTTRERRYVLQPRRVKLFLVPDTHRVRDAWVRGRQVRRDGELATRSEAAICCHRQESRGWPSSEVPAWLEELLAVEGLTWATD